MSVVLAVFVAVLMVENVRKPCFGHIKASFGLNILFLVWWAVNQGAKPRSPTVTSLLVRNFRTFFPPRLARRSAAKKTKVPRLPGLPSRAQGTPKRRGFRRAVSSSNAKRQQPSRVVSHHAKQHHSRRIVSFAKRHVISLRTSRHRSRRTLPLRAKRHQSLRDNGCTAAAAASGGSETPTVRRREREFRPGIFFEAL